MMTRDIKGRFKSTKPQTEVCECKKEENCDYKKVESVEERDFSYYSKLLKKPFDTLEALQKAEDEFKKAHEAELKAKEEKSTAAKEIQDAYVAYRKLIIEHKKAEDEAYSNYLKKRNEFIKKYGSYHMTYSSPDTIIKYNYDIFDNFFDNIFKF